MACPNCDSEDFGAAELNDEVVRHCTNCHYTEEASPSEIALFLMEDHGGPGDDDSPPPPEDFYPQDAEPEEDLDQHFVESEAPEPEDAPSLSVGSRILWSPNMPVGQFVTAEQVAALIRPEGETIQGRYGIGGSEVRVVALDEEGNQLQAQHLEATPMTEEQRAHRELMKAKLMEERARRRQQLPCKFFCPSSEKPEEEEPADWPWDRRLPFPACSNPAVTGPAGIGPCQYPDMRGSCPARRDPAPATESQPFIVQLVS